MSNSPDRPARHRFAALIYRIAAIVMMVLIGLKSDPTDQWQMAALLLIGFFVILLLLLIAVLHDLVAATLRPKFWFTSLRAGDREIHEGGIE